MFLFKEKHGIQREMRILNTLGEDCDKIELRATTYYITERPIEARKAKRRS